MKRMEATRPEKMAEIIAETADNLQAAKAERIEFQRDVNCSLAESAGILFLHSVNLNFSIKEMFKAITLCKNVNVNKKIKKEINNIFLKNENARDSLTETFKYYGMKSRRISERLELADNGLIKEVYELNDCANSYQENSGTISEPDFLHKIEDTAHKTFKALRYLRTEEMNDYKIIMGLMEDLEDTAEKFNEITERIAEVKTEIARELGERETQLITVSQVENDKIIQKAKANINRLEISLDKLGDKLWDIHAVFSKRYDSFIAAV